MHSSFRTRISQQKQGTFQKVFIYYTSTASHKGAQAMAADPLSIHSHSHDAMSIHMLVHLFCHACTGTSIYTHTLVHPHTYTQPTTLEHLNHNSL